MPATCSIRGGGSLLWNTAGGCTGTQRTQHGEDGLHGPGKSFRHSLSE
jgi:hypothetical protein